MQQKERENKEKRQMSRNRKYIQPIENTNL